MTIMRDLGPIPPETPHLVRTTVHSPLLAYHGQGRGPAVLLIHGLGLCGGIWRQQLDSLSRHGYRVIAPDLRGFGQSEPGREPFSLAACGEDLIALLDHLGIGRAVVCGISLGGAVLLEMLARHPDRLAGACLVATRAQPETDRQKSVRRKTAARLRRDDSENALDSLVAPLPVGKGAVAPPWLPLVRSALAGADRKTLAEALLAGESRPDSIFRAGCFRRPVLALGGGRDRLVPPEQERQLARSFALGAWRLLPDAGHLVNLDRPEEFNATLLEFLGAVRRGGEI